MIAKLNLIKVDYQLKCFTLFLDNGMCFNIYFNDIKKYGWSDDISPHFDKLSPKDLVWSIFFMRNVINSVHLQKSGV